MKTAHKRKHRRQAMQILSNSGPSLHEVVYQQAHGCCWYCGRAVQRPQITLDHLTPIVRGGTHSLMNIVASCRTCNSAKGAMTLEEFRAKCGVKAFAGEQAASTCHV